MVFLYMDKVQKEGCRYSAARCSSIRKAERLPATLFHEGGISGITIDDRPLVEWMMVTVDAMLRDVI
jgi:hypothetical protein